MLVFQYLKHTLQSGVLFTRSKLSKSRSTS